MNLIFSCSDIIYGREGIATIYRVQRVSSPESFLLVQKKILFLRLFIEPLVQGGHQAGYVLARSLLNPALRWALCPPHKGDRDPEG